MLLQGKKKKKKTFSEHINKQLIQRNQSSQQCTTRGKLPSNFSHRHGAQ